jgi:septal ring factor EnvC (AmiA/AmiB activator)
MKDENEKLYESNYQLTSELEKCLKSSVIEIQRSKEAAERKENYLTNEFVKRTTEHASSLHSQKVHLAQKHQQQLQQYQSKISQLEKEVTTSHKNEVMFKHKIEGLHNENMQLQKQLRQTEKGTNNCDWQMLTL